MKNDTDIRQFEPVRVLLPNEEVARRLADAIRTGFFRIGSRLPSERSLAAQMQISRPTVREAVKLLADAGILIVRPGAGGGIFVASEIVPLDFIVTVPDMRPGEVDEALEVRRLILPWVAMIASQYAEDEDFDRMREAIVFGRMSLPSRSVKKLRVNHIQTIIIATMRFDLAVARATRNRLIVRLMENLLHWVEPLRFKTLHGRDDLVLALDLVEKMLEAIEGGDRDKVARTTQDRLVILENALEEHNGRKLRRRHMSFSPGPAKVA
ncbi:MAG: FadR/GntR family transcriptional regulator [Hyphomicrobiales bacterium]